MLSLILMVFAFVLAVVAGLLGPPYDPWRSRLLCFALACFFLAEILQRTPAIHFG
jgi:hypothetical protein